MTRQLAAFLIASATVVLPITAFGQSAWAGDGGSISVNDGHGWQQDTTAPLFSLGQIIPGWQQVRTFEVRNDGTSPTEVALESTDVTERENGCIHGEAQVDQTCGSGQGELGHALQFSVSVGSATTPSWTGTLYDLETPVVLSPALPTSGTETVHISADLPFTTGDEVETDTVGFDFRIDAEQDPTQVLGETVHRGNSGTVVMSGAEPQSPGQLAMTGIDLLAEIAAGLCLLSAGFALVVFGRSRRRGHAGPSA